MSTCNKLAVMLAYPDAFRDELDAMFRPKDGEISRQGWRNRLTNRRKQAPSWRRAISA